ncbi:MAG: isopropylmalate isomerase [Pseudomonadota bacterium]
MFECIGERWSPGLGDPTVMGWVTVAAYLAASALAFMRARDAFAALTPGGGALKFFWLGASVLLLCLAVNKQLDLQSALTAAGRCLAKYQGWYGERRAVQVVFVLWVGFTGAAVFAAVLWAMRRHLQEQRIVLTGFFILLVFVVMRASSFHHMDSFINFRLAGVRMNWLFEIGALVLIIYGSLRQGLRSSGAQMRRSE